MKRKEFKMNKHYFPPKECLFKKTKQKKTIRPCGATKKKY